MKGRFYTPREAIIPKGAMKISDKRSDAVAYLYSCRNTGQSNGLPAMMVFYGEQSKPVAKYFYRDDAQREAAVKRLFEARQQHDAAKADAHAKRQVGHDESLRIWIVRVARAGHRVETTRRP